MGIFADNTALLYVRKQGGGLFPSGQHGGPASSLFDRGVGDHSGSPVHYGGPECDR